MNTHAILLKLFFCGSLLLFVSMHSALSQCNTDPLPTAQCDIAPMRCVQGIRYTTGSPTPDPHYGWCSENTAIHNAQYFKFRAASPIVSIHIAVNSCDAGGCGLQCALLDSCEWDNSNVLACDPGTQIGDTMTLEYSALEVDSVYWIVIDGCGGQVCEYEFVSVEGFSQIPSIADFSYEVSGDSVVFMNLSQNGLETIWQFGDGTISSEEDPVHHYQVNGTFTVHMISTGLCNSDTIAREVTVTGLAITDLNSSHFELHVVPNPNEGTFILIREGKQVEVVRIVDALGRDVTFTQEDAWPVQICHPFPGIYTVVVGQDSMRYVTRVIIKG